MQYLIMNMCMILGKPKIKKGCLSGTFELYLYHMNTLLTQAEGASYQNQNKAQAAAGMYNPEELQLTITVYYPNQPYNWRQNTAVFTLTEIRP